MDTINEIKGLLTLYTQGRLNERDLLRLQHLLDDPASRTSVADQLEQLWLSGQMPARQDQDLTVLFEQMMDSGKRQSPVAAVHRVHFIKTAWFRYAVAVIAVLAVGGYIWTTSDRSNPSITMNAPIPVKDIPPGTDGAILTLADGRQVVLDSASNGIVARQNGTTVRLLSGQLTYQNVPGEDLVPSFNTVSTPKGKQFRLTLPDGTRVWLNAASSLTYPTRFPDKDRQVRVTGEAYFEVAGNTLMPFRVSVNEVASVDVLGTSFNIKAYGDNGNIKATLVDGRVRVHAGNQSKELRPGQLALVSSSPGIDTGLSVKTLSQATLAGELAWKNKLFNFQDKSIREVMGELSRWYDVEVVYEKTLPDVHFFGQISQELTLAAVLRALQENGLHCRLEDGPRLIVLP